ncbi:Diadenosine hexaphosphate hydrolase [Colletotrichum sp. SAR11_240]|nr:Diadenosine hexaphosphate hydrolase [Colletotrichum sp. SAR11_240]
MATTHRRLDSAAEFVISCGTATIDVQKKKVLVIRCRNSDEHMLPKGRKDLNETLEDAAKREAYEETSVRVNLLPVNIPTRATTPSSIAPVDRPTHVTEPIAVAQRVSDGVLKIIFWFVAAADSTISPEEGTQQEDEDFEVSWVDVEEVGDRLSFADDQRIAREACAAVFGLG